MKRQRLVITLLLASCIVLASLVLTSFTSYAPSVGRIEMQNIYIGNILIHCAIAGLLQLTAIGLLLRKSSAVQPGPG